MAAQFSRLLHWRLVRSVREARIEYLARGGELSKSIVTCQFLCNLVTVINVRECVGIPVVEALIAKELAVIVEDKLFGA